MLLCLGIGSHGDCLMKLFGSHKSYCNGQWLLTSHYFKCCPCGTHRHFHKGNFVTKKFFLFTPSFNWSHQEADICREILQLHSVFLTFFLIFHFKHVLREVGRKVVMKPKFSMDKGFKTQVCLWAPLPINLI